MLQKFGGFVEGQYYFTNQWFVNALYAFSKAFNVSRSQANFGLPLLGSARSSAFTGDNATTIQQMEATLWYRPIQAIKFGLQYSYMAANYPQQTWAPAGVNTNSPALWGQSPGGVCRVLLLLTSKSVDFKQPTGYYPCGLFS